MKEDGQQEYITTLMMCTHQAPSLLITLINMFLEFGSSPAVNATVGADVDDNEYSVFGPTEGLADVQVDL